MEVVIADSDVVTLILEYLQSCGLISSADALENESGLPSMCESKTKKDHVLEMCRRKRLIDVQIAQELRVSLGYAHTSLSTLHEFAHEGKWVSVGQILHPVMEMLDPESNKKILFLLFRQRFFELCFSNEETTVQSALQDIVEELQLRCCESEFDCMTESIYEYYNAQVLHYPAASVLSSTRLQCIHDISMILEPVIGVPTKHLHENNERLLSLLVKGVLYDYCCDYCEYEANTTLVKRRQDLGSQLLADTFMRKSSLSNICKSPVRKLIAEDNQRLRNALNQKREKIFVKRVNDLSKNTTSEPPPSSVKPNRVTTEAPHVTNAWADANKSSRRPSSDERNDEVPGDERDSSSPSTRPSPPSRKTDETVAPINRSGNELAMFAGGDHVNVGVKDSYVDFLAEQSEVRKQRDRVLKEIQLKQEQAEGIRRDLLACGDVPQRGLIESPSSSPHGKVPSESPPTHRSARVVLQYCPVEKTDDISAVRAVAFHPHGQVYAVGSNAQTLKICAVPRAFPGALCAQNRNQDLSFSRVVDKRTHVHKASVYAVAWNSKGTLLATCSNDKLIKLFSYDCNMNTLTGSLNELAYHKGVVRDITFVKDYGSGAVLSSAGSLDCLVYTFDCQLDTMLQKFSGHTDQILSLYSWGRGHVVSSSQDRSVRLWDLRTSRCVSVLGFGASPNSPSIPTSVCVDDIGRHLVVGRDDRHISVYDLHAGKVVKDFEAHQGEVRSVRFNPSNNSLLLSGSYDGSALVTDIHAALLADVTDLQSISYRCCHHADKVIQCRWHPSGHSFASTSADHTCVLWLQQHLQMA